MVLLIAAAAVAVASAVLATVFCASSAAAAIVAATTLAIAASALVAVAFAVVDAPVAIVEHEIGADAVVYSAAVAMLFPIMIQVSSCAYRSAFAVELILETDAVAAAATEFRAALLSVLVPQSESAYALKVAFGSATVFCSGDHCCCCFGRNQLLAAHGLHLQPQK